jgi:hypothetical protein
MNSLLVFHKKENLKTNPLLFPLTKGDRFELGE